MDQEIREVAVTFFELAREAELTTATSIEDFLPTSELVEIVEKLESERVSFLAGNSDLPSAGQLWAKGQTEKIKEALQWYLVNFAVKQGKAALIDWKFSAEDIVFNIKKVFPGLDLLSLGQTEVDGEWLELISLNGEHYRFTVGTPDFIDRIFHTVNQFIEATGKSFIRTDYHTDDIYYLLVPAKALAHFRQFGFVTPL